MPPTRVTTPSRTDTTDQQAMSYIVTTILGEKVEDGPISAALEMAHIAQPFDLVSLTLEDYQTLSTDRDRFGNQVEPYPLPLVLAKQLAYLVDYHTEIVFAT